MQALIAGWRSHPIRPTCEAQAHGRKQLKVQRLVGVVWQAPKAQQVQALALQAAPAGPGAGSAGQAISQGTYRAISRAVRLLV